MPEPGRGRGRPRIFAGGPPASFKISALLRMRIAAIAQAQGKSFSELCREALEEKFGKNGQDFEKLPRREGLTSNGL